MGRHTISIRIRTIVIPRKMASVTTGISSDADGRTQSSRARASWHYVCTLTSPLCLLELTFIRMVNRRARSYHVPPTALSYMAQATLEPPGQYIRSTRRHALLMNFMATVWTSAFDPWCARQAIHHTGPQLTTFQEFDHDVLCRRRLSIPEYVILASRRGTGLMSFKGCEYVAQAKNKNQRPGGTMVWTYVGVNDVGPTQEDAIPLGTQEDDEYPPWCVP